jgi:hypothetical protein
MRIERVTRVNEIAAYKQRKDIMRNYELLKEILEILNETKRVENFLSPVEFKIKTLIEEQRPELLDKPATGCDYGIGG